MPLTADQQRRVAQAQVDPAPTLDGLQAMIGAWHDETFGAGSGVRRLDAIAEHLIREAFELRNGKPSAPPYQPPHQPEEAADCAILLLAHAARASYSLHQAILERFAVLQTRTWGEPDADGVIEHVREADP